MHPSQAGPFRKTLIVLLEIVFTGALLVFTSMANLDLLKSVYPDPKFYMFGLLALEGGVLVWFAFYLLHLSGVHKALCLFALAIDALISGTGFFYELEATTKSIGTVGLPPIIIIVGFAVVFNVTMGLIVRLLPSGGGVQVAYATPKQDNPNYSGGYQQQSFSQEATVESGEKKPSFFQNAAASMIAGTQDTLVMAQEKRKRGRPAKEATAPLEEEAQTSNTQATQ